MKINFKKFPIINGIMYGDGYIEGVDILTQSDRKRILRKHRFCSQSDIIYSHAYPNSELILEEMNSKNICGEGSYGGDGFILSMTLDSNQLLWLASFDDSNPFISIQLKEHRIYVTNNCYEVWKIDVINKRCIEMSIVENGFMS